MSVRAVALIKPPMTTTASGARRSDPRPSPSAIGVNPSTVVTVVMMMGRRRTLPASSIASRRARPCRRIRLMKSTLTIASFTTMPTRITMPIRLIVLRPAPVSHRAPAAPTVDSGTLNKIVNGCTNDSNWAARIMYTKINARPNAKARSRKLCSRSSFSPPMSQRNPRGGGFAATASRTSAKAPSNPPEATSAYTVTVRDCSTRLTSTGPSVSRVRISSRSGTP